ncbi:MAG: hypothetical protein M1832_006185 [Thelocarpon impressellum]|nr:MAG: hypothetical protein M1832_006185 [Thelocarpon impressellum]
MQGFNMGRYVPPEHEGTTSANKLAGKNALGARARKSSQGILTVRFEMPFPIWCTSCPKPTIIGQGVRFNAEKKKVGNYYTTPIYSFRMKHNVCGSAIEIRTDPANTAYVVTEGAKKRDTGEDKILEGEIPVKTEEERERIRNDAFATLEGKVEDKRRALTESTRVEELRERSERDWADPYADNKRLRRAFRASRKVRERDAEATEALKTKMGLSIDLLDEREEDKVRAGFVEFGALGSERTIEQAKARPLFPAPNASPNLSKPPKSHRPSSLRKKTKEKDAAAQARTRLTSEIRSNSRAVLDPFLSQDLTAQSAGYKPFAGLKRARSRESKAGSSEKADSTIGVNVDEDAERNRIVPTAAALGLVVYDSD